MLEGLYFVAVQYGPGAGVFDFATWNGRTWVLKTEGNVVAFMEAQSFKNQLDIQWPSAEVESYSAKSGEIDDSWEEVNS